MSQLHFSTAFPEDFVQQKPREKLTHFGAAVLQPWEILAILLRVGTHGKQGENVEQLSRRVMAEAGMKGLFSQTDASVIQETYGVHASHAYIIAAVAEVARRMNDRFDLFDASTPHKIFQKFEYLQKAKQEQCHVIHIDSSGKSIHSEMIGMGDSKNVSVTPNAVFRSALWLSAEKIAVIHNHLGSSRPSEEDIIWTTTLARIAWETFRIQITDHIIIGAEEKNDSPYFSFAENGLL